MFKNTVIVSAAVVGEIIKGKFKLFLVKLGDNSDWELPKLTIRKTESSVRGALRMMGEQAGMRVRILDEAARFSSNTVVGGKTVQQKIFYYTMIHKADSGESIGFNESVWLEYAKAYKRLVSKKEKEALSNANKTLKEWWKRRKTRMKKRAQQG